MANLPEILQFDAGVYQIETTDPVLGGPNGLSNVPLKNLANRTAYLKKHVDDIEAGTTVPPGIATEAFVTAEINKLDNKQSVRAATTANITLAGTQIVDGVNLVSGDRVLVKNQTAPAENGLYVVQGAGWIRTGDADSNTDVTPGLVVAVEEGALQGDTVWKLTTNAPIAVGTTGLTFADITTGYAPLASPAFTGAPTAPTPAQGDNSLRIATSAFVQQAIASLINSSPAALDTLFELAAALGNDANFATTITNLVGTKVSKSGDTMTGSLAGRGGAALPGNENNAGFVFGDDVDSGMFGPADGSLQFAVNGAVFLETTVDGALKAFKQIRVPKGAPNSADMSVNAGYTFNDDGDTGIFAEGGSANSASDLVLRIDNGEVARFKASMKSAGVSGWARLSCGVIIQWGEFVQTDTGSAVPFTWTLPVVFPNASHQGVLTVGGSIGTGAINCSIEGVGTNNAVTGFTVGPAASRKYRIFVIGD